MPHRGADGPRLVVSASPRTVVTRRVAACAVLAMLVLGAAGMYGLTGHPSGERWLGPPRAVTRPLAAYPPPTPAGFTVDPGNRTVQGSWSSSAPSTAGGTVTYTLNWSGYAGGPVLGSVTTTNTTATATDLENGDTYFFSVAARDAYGDSSGTGLIASTPHSVPFPPTLIEVTSLSSSSVGVDWSPPNDDGGQPVTSYSVFYATAADGPWTDYVVGTDLQIELVGLSSATPYFIQIVADNDAGVSHPSRTMSTTTWVSMAIPPKTTPTPEPTPVASPPLLIIGVPGSTLLAILGGILAVLLVLPLVLLILRWRRPQRRRGIPPA